MKHLCRSFFVLAILFIASDIPARTVAPAQTPGNAKANNHYVVQMIDWPAASYTGSVPGLRATKPNRGQKLDPGSPDVLAYAGYLNNRHAQVFPAIGGGRKIYDYHHTFNGF